MEQVSKMRPRQKASGGRRQPDYAILPSEDRLWAAIVLSVMMDKVLTIGPEWPLVAAAQVMRQRRISGLPVVDEGHHLVGVLSEKDILADLDRAEGIGRVRGVIDLLMEGRNRRGGSHLEQSLRRLEHAKVSQAMATRPVVIDADASMGQALRLLRQFSVNRLPMVEGEQLGGIITRQDILDPHSVGTGPSFHRRLYSRGKIAR